MVTKKHIFEKPKYQCKYCNFSSDNKTLFARHVNTVKHNDNKKTQKTHFICDCGKSFTFNSGLSRHIAQCKNVRNANKMLTNANISKQTYQCQCGKKYNHRSTLSRHKKTCMFQKMHTVVSNVETSREGTIFETVKNDIQDALQKELQIKLVNNNITNITHNRSSNNQINIYLNEKCHDAMSIQDFARHLSFTIDDVLMNKHDALVSVINKNLDPLEVTERPVHCTNSTRRRWHVKDETEGWCKDDGSALMREVNNSLLSKTPAIYAETFPDWNNEPHRQDEYVKIIQMTSSDLEPKAKARVLTAIGDATLLNIIE